MPPLVGVAVIVTEVPEQIVVAGEALTLTLAASDEPTVTGKYCVLPTQPAKAVSVTETVPLVTPNVTVMEFVFVPAVILAPDGTVQAYVEPAVLFTE